MAVMIVLGIVAVGVIGLVADSFSGSNVAGQAMYMKGFSAGVSRTDTTSGVTVAVSRVTTTARGVRTSPRTVAASGVATADRRAITDQGVSPAPRMTAPKVIAARVSDITRRDLSRPTVPKRITVQVEPKCECPEELQVVTDSYIDRICIETDSAYHSSNNIFIQEMMTGTDGSELWDRCEGSSVVQFSCSDEESTAALRPTTCEYGCVRGACREQADIDGFGCVRMDHGIEGRLVATIGGSPRAANRQTGFLMNTCVSDNTLIEYSCGGFTNSRQRNIVTCERGCRTSRTTVDGDSLEYGYCV